MNKLESKKLTYKYELLWNESPDPLFITNSEYNILEGNPAMTRLLGNENHTWGNLKELFRKDEDFTEFNKTLYLNEHVEDFEVELVSSEGKVYHCILQFVKSTTEDGIDTYLGFIRNVTQRKKVEKRLLMAEKLTVTGTIARTIAHELRNPLTNLNLSLDQLQEELPENSDGEFYIEILHRNIGRIENLISELLNSSKPKEYSFQNKPLKDTIRSAIELVEDRYLLKKMEIKTSFEELPLISHDPDQLKIAFVNLMINASEAMKKGEGVLNITTEKAGDEVLISFSDNGNGINKESLPRLFEPFYSKSKEKGMGLGLTTVQNIINGHHGHIEVESEVGQGTTFMIYLSV